jgi:hypothetical protein
MEPDLFSGLFVARRAEKKLNSLKVTFSFSP